MGPEGSAALPAVPSRWLGRGAPVPTIHISALRPCPVKIQTAGLACGASAPINALSPDTALFNQAFPQSSSDSRFSGDARVFGRSAAPAGILPSALPGAEQWLAQQGENTQAAFSMLPTSGAALPKMAGRKASTRLIARLEQFRMKARNLEAQNAQIARETLEIEDQCFRLRRFAQEFEDRHQSVSADGPRLQLEIARLRTQIQVQENRIRLQYSPLAAAASDAFLPTIEQLVSSFVKGQ